MKSPRSAMLAQMMKENAGPAPLAASSAAPPSPAPPETEQAPPLELQVQDHPELKNVQPGDDVVLEVHATVDAVSPDGEVKMTMHAIVAQSPAVPPTPNEAYHRARTRAMAATPESGPQGA